MGRILLVLLTLTCAPLAFALEASEVLEDKTLEARARVLCAKVKCPTCQGQCIEDSNAKLAGELRRFIREAVVAGASDEAILASLVQTYGQEVLFEPAWEGQTMLLWGAPFIFLFVCAGMWGYKRRRHL